MYRVGTPDYGVDGIYVPSFENRASPTVLFPVEPKPSSGNASWITQLERRRESEHRDGYAWLLQAPPGLCDPSYCIFLIHLEVRMTGLREGCMSPSSIDPVESWLTRLAYGTQLMYTPRA